MSSATAIGEASPAAASVSPRLEEFLAILSSSQHADGGWGYRRHSQSATEPACWALLALSGSRRRDVTSAAVNRGLDWLCRVQQPDGSWCTFADGGEGRWVTSLACLVLNHFQSDSKTSARGLEWLCRTQPAEGRFWMRFRQQLARRNAVMRQNPSLRGWNWTPRTASWVEPTSHAILALASAPPGLLPKSAETRRALAEAMLYDRMCPGGGWNSGNPMVYGIGGLPRVGPTVWALLALASHSSRSENQASLQWLANEWREIQGSASLALAHLGLSLYGATPGDFHSRLNSQFEANRFLDDIRACALSTIALQGGAGLFSRRAPTKGRP